MQAFTELKRPMVTHIIFVAFTCMSEHKPRKAFGPHVITDRQYLLDKAYGYRKSRLCSPPCLLSRQLVNGNWSFMVTYSSTLFIITSFKAPLF